MSDNLHLSLVRGGMQYKVTSASRHCKAGDEITRDIELPADVLPWGLAGRVLYRCLPPQHSVTLQHSRPATFGSHHGWPAPCTSPPQNDR